MENIVYYNNLFDIYKELLTKKQQEIFKLYFEENWSMQEIAEDNQVSKSFVGKVVKDCENKLEYYEKIFHLYEYKTKLREIESIDDLDKIKKIVKNIVNNI